MGHQVVGMEDYVAEDLRPLSRCLADVESCDVYVGIFAWRYGSLATDAGSSGLVLPSNAVLGKTSVTECELRQAIDKNKPVLAFLLDQNAEWSPNYFDAITGDGENGKAITRLRQELGQKFMISYFRTPEDLASLVSASIYRAEMGRQMTLKSIDIEAGLNQPWVRKDTPVNDSALGTIQSAIAGPKDIQALQIDVGQGLDWWMTRLYFLTSMAADLTSIEVMVFLGENDSFLGVAHPRIVQERLLHEYPDLQRYETALTVAGRRAADLPNEVKRRADCWQATMGPTENVSPIWVTNRELRNWLFPYFITQCVEWDGDSGSALQIQRLLDWPMRFVPVVEKNRFTRVVDKQALTDQVARIFVRDQVARALSTFR